MPQIFMYNTYHGDCFRIDDGNRNLVVDFGIHRCSKITGKGMPSSGCRDIICDRIWSDLTSVIKDTKHPMDILITHFHEDHIYGLTYRLTHKKGIPFQFDILYMPDIFSREVSTPAISLILLEELLSGYYLKGSKCNLCELCKFLCKGVYHVRLLKRKDIIPGYGYQVLWPNIDTLQPNIDSLIENLSLAGKSYFRELFSIATDISNSVTALSRMEGISPQDPHVSSLFQTFRQLQERLELMQGKFDWNKESSLVQLNKTGNWISIVFHNAVCGDENLLFTGDIEFKYMDIISKDTELPLHPHYKYIKIPHHGTDTNHYVDFHDFDPEVLMIPSGLSSSVSMISSKYSTLASHTPIPHIFCSNCNHCESYGKGPSGKCLCQKRTIIFSSPEVAAGIANKKLVT